MALVNSGNASKREQHKFFNTLAALVKNLENRYTTVDLINECCVTGKILKADGFMNIEMEDVVFYDMRGNRKHLENFFVSARNIRNVQIPKNADAIKMLTSQLEGMSRKRRPAKVSFKQSRAMKNHLETVANIKK